MSNQEHQHQVLPTIGEIARNNNVPIHRVEYAVKSLGIEPAARAGGLRVFSDADIARICAALTRTRPTLPSDAAGNQSSEGGAQ